MPENEFVLLYRKALATALAEPSEANLQHACSYAELAGQRVDVMAALALTSAQYDSLSKGGPKVVAEPQAVPETSIAELVSGICDREAKIHALEIEGTQLSVDQGHALLALKEKVRLGGGKWETWWQCDEGAFRLRATIGDIRSMQNHARLARYAADHPEVLRMKLGDARIACGIYKMQETREPASTSEPKLPTNSDAAQPAIPEGQPAEVIPAPEQEQQAIDENLKIKHELRAAEEKWFNLPPVPSPRDDQRAMPVGMSDEDPDVVIDCGLFVTALEKTTRAEFGDAFKKFVGDPSRLDNKGQPKNFTGAQVHIEAIPGGAMTISALGQQASVKITLYPESGLLDIRRYFRAVTYAKTL